MLASSRQLSAGNRILDALPREELARLLPFMEKVDLKKGETVYLTGDDIKYAYFPEKNGLLSLLFTTENGSTVEVASVGSEGVVGLPVILRNPLIQYEVMVQFTTKALKIRANKLQEEFDKGGAFYESVLRYLDLVIAQISQSTVCHRFHPLEKTLSRWLLTIRDRVNSDTLSLTHEIISNSLGAPRTAITMAAGNMQRAGLIKYSRGKIFILNRAGLEANSCECYRIIRDQLHHFMNNDQAPSNFRHSPVLDRQRR